MFCPSCGSEERQLSQFCRACGTDLRVVRAGLEGADNVTDAAVKARDQIGRAIADKIRELKKPGELAKMAEDVLPKIEEFLESPEEKRLRRMRSAVITSAIGLGVMISFILVALAANDPGLLIPAGGGLVTFLISIAMMLNARLFTVPKNQITDHSPEAALQKALDRSSLGAVDAPRKLFPAQTQPPSIIEHTTHRLQTGPPIARSLRVGASDESREN